MDLNSDIDLTAIPVDVRRAFLWTPEKISLPKHTRLYRWAGHPLQIGRLVSPWWCLVHSMRLPSGELFEGFWVSARRAKRLNRPLRDYARVRTAISHDFKNPMTHLVVVKLNVPVIGLAGKASGQPEFEKELVDLQHVYQIGGGHQLWIPSLRHPEHVCPDSIFV